LIRKNTFYCCYGVFKVRASRAREKAAKCYTRGGGLSKLNSVNGPRARLVKSRPEGHAEVDVVPGEPEGPDGSRPSNGFRRLPE